MSLSAHSGINNGVGYEVVRQVEIVSVTVKGELEDSHARKPKGSAQGGYLRGDDAEIFRDDSRFPGKGRGLLKRLVQC